MLRLALVVVPLIAFAGCQKENPAYCMDNPGKQGCPPDAPSGGPCMSNPDCTNTPGFPVCDAMDNGGTCVLCTANDHALCTGTTPVCDNHSCVACTRNDDCGTGGLCLPSGACASSDNIIHAVSTAAGMDVPGCGNPGTECKLERALTEVTASKNVIKLDDAGPYTPDTNNFVVNVNVTIDARGAVLHHKADNSPVLMINSDKSVTLFGGTIELAHGTNGDGIQCAANATLTVDTTTLQFNDESGIDASSCTLTVTNANIHDNSKAVGTTFFAGIEALKGTLTISRSKLVSNKGGGITVTNGTFVVVGNMFLSNGDPMANAGGVSFTNSPPGNRLEFNTFANNKSTTGIAPGIQCLVAGFKAQNNIVWSNTGNNPTGVQVGGTCVQSYSDIGPPAIPSILGIDDGTNISSNPMLIDPTMDLHVKAGSPVQGKAHATPADLMGIASQDIEGHPRVVPADLGAYVVPAQ